MINYQHILTYNSVSKTLEDAPAGWEEWTRRYYRHLTYHGVLMSDATSQRFVRTDGVNDGGGYSFIQDAFESQGVKAQIYYTRKIQDPFTKVWETDYTGLLDLSPDGGFSIEEEWIEAKTIDSSKLQSFISNNKIDYDLNSVTATNGNTVTSFTNWPQKCTYSAIDVYLEALSDGEISGVDSISVDSSGSTLYDRVFEINAIGDRVITQTLVRKIYENTSDDSINLTFELEGIEDYETIFYPNTPIVPNSADIDVGIYLIIKNSSDVEVSRVEFDRIQESVTNITSTETITNSGNVTQNTTIDVTSGYYVEFVMEWEANMDEIEIDYSWVFIVSELFMYEKYSFDSTLAYSYLQHETATRLIQLMTGETDTSKLINSEILGRTDSEFQTYASDGDLAYLATSSGWSLRNFPDYSIKLNFEDWFKTLDYMANLALWYDKPNDRFVIEGKAQAYRNEEILSIGEVKNLKKTLHQESYFSKINSGSLNKGIYEEVSGVLEPNVQSNHSIDVPANNQKTIRAIYNTDTLSAVFTKPYQYYSTGSEDTRHDEKIMIIELDSTLTTIPNSGLGTYEGFLGIDERWNGRWTARQCIENSGNWIGASLYKEVDGVIQFTGNAKDIVITYDGVSETDPVTKAELGEPLYYPEVYEFEGYVDYSIIQQLDSDPHGYITFQDSDGNEYKGFILEVEIQDYARTATYKLIKLNPNR